MNKQREELYNRLREDRFHRIVAFPFPQDILEEEIATDAEEKPEELPPPKKRMVVI